MFSNFALCVKTLWRKMSTFSLAQTRVIEEADAVRHSIVKRQLLSRITWTCTAHGCGAIYHWDISHGFTGLGKLTIMKHHTAQTSSTSNETLVNTLQHNEVVKQNQ